MQRYRYHFRVKFRCYLENPPGLFKGVTQLRAGESGRERIVADGNVLLGVVGLDHALGNGPDHNADGLLGGWDKAARLSGSFRGTIAHQDLAATWDFRKSTFDKLFEQSVIQFPFI